MPPPSPDPAAPAIPRAVPTAGRGFAEPPRDCPLCPRLAAFREAQREAHPGWHNAPVPVWGDADARIAIVGLAPGLQGANRTGRPFTGDFAGELLYATLLSHGLARGTYGARPDDGLALTGAVIVNAVRCVPPQNKPTPEEIATCRRFLAPVLAGLAGVRVVVALGQIAHQSAARTLGLVPSRAKFGHGAEHPTPAGPMLIDSYHCSRYNQNTRVLSPAMFDAVFARAVALAGEDGPGGGGRDEDAPGGGGAIGYGPVGGRPVGGGPGGGAPGGGRLGGGRTGGDKPDGGTPRVGGPGSGGPGGDKRDGGAPGGSGSDDDGPQGGGPDGSGAARRDARTRAAAAGGGRAPGGGAAAAG